MQRDILRVVSRVPGADAAKRAGAKIRATAARSAKKAAIGLLAVAGFAGLAWMTSPSSPTALAATEIANEIVWVARREGEPNREGITETVLGVVDLAAQTQIPVPLTGATGATGPTHQLTEAGVIRDATEIRRWYVSIGGAVVVASTVLVFMVVILAIMKILAYVHGKPRATSDRVVGGHHPVTTRSTDDLYLTAIALVAGITKTIAALRSREQNRAFGWLLVVSFIVLKWSSVLGVPSGAPITLDFTQAPDAESLVGLANRHVGDMGHMARSIVRSHLDHIILIGETVRVSPISESVLGYVRTIDVPKMAQYVSDLWSLWAVNGTAAENATLLIKDIVDETPNARGEAAGVGSFPRLIEFRLNASGITGADKSILLSVLTETKSNNTIVAREIRAVAVGMASGSVLQGAPAERSAALRAGIDEMQRMSSEGTSDRGDARASIVDNTEVGKAAWEQLVCKSVGTGKGNESNYAYTKSAADRRIITLTPPVGTPREAVTVTHAILSAASEKPAPAGHALVFNPGTGGLYSYWGPRSSVRAIRVFDNFTSADSAINTKNALVLASAVAGLDSLFMDAVSAHAQNEPKEPKEPKEPNGGAETKQWEGKFETWATELGCLMSVRLVLTAHLSALFGLPDPLGWLYEGKSESLAAGAEMGRVGYVVFRLTGALTNLRGLITSGTATGESSTPALMQVVALIQTVLPETKTSSDSSDKSDKSVALADTTVRSWTSLAHGVTGSQTFLWFLDFELHLIQNAMPDKGTIAALHHGAHGLVWHAVSEARRVLDTLIYEPGGKLIEPPKDFDGTTVTTQVGAIRSRMDELGTQVSPMWNRLQGHFAQAAGFVDTHYDVAQDAPEAQSANAADATPTNADTENTADAQKKLDAAAKTARQTELAKKHIEYRKQFDAEKTKYLKESNGNRATRTKYGVALELIRKIWDFKPDSGSHPTQPISGSWDTNLYMWWTSGAVNTPEFAVVAREALQGPHFQDGNLPSTQEVITILNDGASARVPTAAEYDEIIVKWEPKGSVTGAEDVAALSEKLLASLKNAHTQTKKIEEALAASAAKDLVDKRTQFFDAQVAKNKHLPMPKQVSWLVALIALEKNKSVGQGPWYVQRKGWDDSGLLTQISHKLLGSIFREVLNLPRFGEDNNPEQVALVIPMIDALSQPDAATAETVDTAASIQTVLSKLDAATADAPQCAAAAPDSGTESPAAQACKATNLIRTMLLDAIEKCNTGDTPELMTEAAFGAAASRARRARKQEPRRFL